MSFQTIKNLRRSEKRVIEVDSDRTLVPMECHGDVIVTNNCTVNNINLILPSPEGELPQSIRFFNTAIPGKKLKITVANGGQINLADVQCTDILVSDIGSHIMLEAFQEGVWVDTIKSGEWAGTPNNGLVAKYTFEDIGVDELLDDESGNGWNLTVNNVGSSEYAIVGKSGYFDGGNSYCYNATHPLGMVPSNDVTVTGWFKSLTSGEQTIMTLFGDYEWSLKLNLSGELQFDVITNDSVAHQAKSTSTYFSSSVKFFIAEKTATYGMRLYVDNVLVSSDSTATKPMLSTGLDSVAYTTIGAYKRTGYNYTSKFSGYIDDIFIYDRVLTSSEMTNLYRRGYDSLLVEYPMIRNPIASGELLDTSGHMNHGTVVNMDVTMSGELIGTSLIFKSGQHVTMPQGVFPTNNFMVSGWVKPFVTDVPMTIFDCGDINFKLQISGEQFYAVGCDTASGQLSTITTLDGGVYAQKPYQFVVAKTSSNGLEIYINKELKALNRTFSGEVQTISLTNYLGRDQENTQWFSGEIDQFRVYQRPKVLNAQERQILFDELGLGSALVTGEEIVIYNVTDFTSAIVEALIQNDTAYCISSSNYLYMYTASGHTNITAYCDYTISDDGNFPYYTIQFSLQGNNQASYITISHFNKKYKHYFQFRGYGTSQWAICGNGGVFTNFYTSAVTGTHTWKFIVDVSRGFGGARCNCYLDGVLVAQNVNCANTASLSQYRNHWQYQYSSGTHSGMYFKNYRITTYKF